MANGKFWILTHKGRVVIEENSFPLRLSTKSPIGSSGLVGGIATYNSLSEAERAASEITKKYGGDVYIMESIALATVPTTIVKIER